MSVDHYENFPVASLLCPPLLRPAVRAIYHFARTADDLADEGDLPPADRLAALAAYREALAAALQGRTGGRWARVFGPLAEAVDRHRLPAAPLQALLSAFEQDVHNPRYDDRAQLLDYCARSANPVGRLLLHLYDVADPAALAQSDAVCSALQLANFWQDLSVDLARGRCYVPLADAYRHGVDAHALRPGPASPATRALVAELLDWTRALMLRGAPLVHRLPGRAGWELRLVVQGGLRIVEKSARVDVLQRRPRIGVADAPPLLWRAARMARA